MVGTRKVAENKDYVITHIHEIITSDDSLVNLSYNLGSLLRAGDLKKSVVI